MKIKELISKTIMKKEQGGSVLDILLFLMLVVFFIIILTYFNITFSTLIADIKKFFGLQSVIFKGVI
ncbi:MAG: hypothetical protein ACP5L4_02060 [Thermoplasmata archaeon]